MTYVTLSWRRGPVGGTLRGGEQPRKSQKMHAEDKKWAFYFADSFLFPTFALPYRGNMLL